MVRTYIGGKLCKRIGIICKARTLLNLSTLVTLYNSFELPYISYCIDVWGNTFDKYLLPLYVTCHIKTSPMSQDIENELVSGAQVSTEAHWGHGVFYFFSHFHNSPGRDTNSPGQDSNSPGRDTNSPGQDTNLPGRDTNSPGRDTNSPGQDTNSPGRVSSLSRPGKLVSCPGKLVSRPGELVSRPGELVAYLARAS